MCLANFFLNVVMDVSPRMLSGRAFHNFVVAGTKEFWNAVVRFLGSVWVLALRNFLPVSLIRVLGRMEVIYVGS